MNKLILLLFFSISQFAFGQCVNTIEPSCTVYDSCFEKNCNCSSSKDEYFISFGKKYCEAFLSEKEFSPEGEKWKTSTLRCLQEKIVPLIPLDGTKSCNCEQIKLFSVGTHAECYTQPENSVCDLSLSDISLIAKTIIFNETFINLLKERESAFSQVIDVTEKCSASAKKEENRSRWKFLSKTLKTKVSN